MITINQKGNPIIEAVASIPYQLAYGPSWFRFFEGFKEERIFGTKCPECRRVLIPARTFCPRCFVDMEEWIEVSDKGAVINWAICNLHFYGQPVEPPFITAWIRLDGADNSFMHYIGGFDLSDLDLVKKTMTRNVRVKAEWKKEKEGSILDIKHFKPLTVS
jgi:uncharacterized OB-fold protein